MNARPQRPVPRRALIGVVVVACVVGVAALIRTGLETPDPRPGTPARDVADVAPPRPDPREPAPSFDTFLHVAATGGDQLTREAAIGWLDARARERRPLDAAAESRVLEILGRNGHPSWSSGYRLHLFNSAFNALRFSPSPEPLTGLLHRLAVHDADPSMRLYALQHIGSQRSAGSLTGALADEIRATLETFAADPGGDLSGLAVALLVAWNEPETETDTASLELALATAADRARPPDVRVAALHAAGTASLPLARTVSTDTSEPVILRKAAISRLGCHGDAGDLAVLENLRRESGRLDQAVDPALVSLRSRLANPAAPQPIPYQTRPLR